MSGTPSGYDSPPTTSSVVRCVTSSSVVPPRRSTTARASFRPSDHSFPVNTSLSPDKLEPEPRCSFTEFPRCVPSGTFTESITEFGHRVLSLSSFVPFVPFVTFVPFVAFVFALRAIAEEPPSTLIRVKCGTELP